jgi:hypothetical protein
VKEFFKKLWRKIFRRWIPVEEPHIVSLAGNATLQRDRFKKRQRMVTELAKRVLNG